MRWEAIMSTFNEETALYLDIQDYDASYVDIYFIRVDKSGSVSFSAEYGIQFTYVDDLCKWVMKQYPGARYIIPDKFCKHARKVDEVFESVSHVIRLNKYRILDILKFRAENLEKRAKKHLDRVSYPKYFVTNGYMNEYDPIARDETPYTGTCEQDYHRWAQNVRMLGNELPENRGKSLAQIQKERLKEQEEKLEQKIQEDTSVDNLAAKNQ